MNHPTGSIIQAMIEKTRVLINEPATQSKFTDTYLARATLGSAMNIILERAKAVDRGQLMCVLPISMVPGTNEYQLPPNVGRVEALGKRDTAGRMVFDWKPENLRHPNGPGWTIDGNVLRFDPPPNRTDDLELVYIPTNKFACHYGTGTVVDANTFTLASDPTIGARGKLKNEYVGGLLRILGTDLHEEHVILEYDSATRNVTTRTTIEASAGSVTYEVLPFGKNEYWELAATYMADQLGIGRKIEARQADALQMLKKSEMKTLRDSLNTVMGRIPRAFERDTIDSRDRTMFWWNPAVR